MATLLAVEREGAEDLGHLLVQETTLLDVGGEPQVVAEQVLDLLRQVVSRGFLEPFAVLGLDDQFEQEVGHQVQVAALALAVGEGGVVFVSQEESLVLLVLLEFQLVLEGEVSLVGVGYFLEAFQKGVLGAELDRQVGIVVGHYADSLLGQGVQVDHVLQTVQVLNGRTGRVHHEVEQTVVGVVFAGSQVE